MTTADGDKYFVRWRGRLSGPFSLGQLKDMVGRGQLTRLHDLSIDQKAESMTLEVRESNTIAQNLYSKYGFTQTGLRRGYYLDNRENAIIMSTENMKSPAFQANLEKLRDLVSQKLGATTA